MVKGVVEGVDQCSVVEKRKTGTSRDEDCIQAPRLAPSSEVTEEASEVASPFGAHPA